MRKCICQTKKKVLRKNVNISKSTFMSQVWQVGPLSGAPEDAQRIPEMIKSLKKEDTHVLMALWSRYQGSMWIRCHQSKVRMTTAGSLQQATSILTSTRGRQSVSWCPMVDSMQHLLFLVSPLPTQMEATFPGLGPTSSCQRPGVTEMIHEAVPSVLSLVQEWGRTSPEILSTESSLPTSQKKCVCY
jgi:hypothetical protein